ncbi:pyridoxamine 5'-phosphate oxidase-domain-containing protein [Nemania sp. NC0429]|nr:pyridoxamine 5'-phosphate oxidase-domain-containing protein [Nemania sp. NC0429]
MRLPNSIQLLSLAAAAATQGKASTVPPPKSIFSNEPQSGHRIPTSYESAVLGRRILALTPLGTLATVFPADADADAEDEDAEPGRRYGAQENRPAGLGGMPHSLMDYVADCEGDGNPTFLAINIETTFKNVRDGSNISLAQQWTPPYPPDKRIQSSAITTSTTSGLLSRLVDWLGLGSADHDQDAEDSEPIDLVPYSAANLPRFSLLGYVEKIDEGSSAAAALSECFVKKHPDARYWLPGNRIHEAEFVRLVVQHVYWVGGFGDRAYIGWIPVDEWKAVSRHEWERVSLPGEKKGWKEWSVGSTAGDL